MGNAFQLPPTSFAVLLLESSQVTSAFTRGDGFDFSDGTNYLETHTRYLELSCRLGAAEALGDEGDDAAGDGDGLFDVARVGEVARDVEAGDVGLEGVG